MLYNDHSKELKFKDIKDYERQIDSSEKCNVEKFETINKIKKMPYRDRLFVTAIFLYLDKVNKTANINNFLTLEISHQDFLVQFLPLMKNGLTTDGIERILNTLETWGIVKNDKGKKTYSFFLDISLYGCLLYGGISYNSVLNKEGFYYPEPFALLIVEFLHYYNEQEVSVKDLAKFLDLSTSMCSFWINRAKIRISLYQEEQRNDEEKNIKIKDTDPILTEEEIMRRKTWYYNKIFQELEVDHTAYPIKDVTQIQDSYMDSKKKYFDLLGKKDPNELYNLISGSGGNAEAIAAEAIMLLQARGVVAGGAGGCGEATITNTKKITFSNREMNNVIESDNYTPEEKIKAIEDKERLEVERARMRTEYFKSQVINNENKNGGVN